MERSDWLLFLLHLPGHTSQENEPMDRIRIIKTLFLVGREADQRPSNFYEFVPYLYGPYSSEVYADLNNLKQKGCVELMPVLPLNWSYYRLTGKGIPKAQEISQEVPTPIKKKMLETKKLVTELSFLSLLRHVYSKYPEYAATSVIRVS